uniref:PDZK1-interacting protein 1 n=1 Tax=Zonotrichia albicollis TaxID=44394 RepID=A0A8D2M3I3_ZONAL
MPARCLLLLGLLLQLPAAFCQQARGSLQPWSQGVIAVVVFLVLVAIAFVVNRFWCKDKLAPARSGHQWWLWGCWSKENQHAYENTVEPEERVITTAM